MTALLIVGALVALLCLTYMLGELMGWPDPDGGLDVPDARELRVNLQEQIDGLQRDIAEVSEWRKQ